MTTPTTNKPKARTKRTSVPVVDTDTAPTTSVVDALAAPRTSTALVEPLPLALLHPHPSNPRRDLGDLTELADSIRAHGVRQNLLVVPSPDHPGEFRIVIGHRRAAAAALVDPHDVVPAAIDADLDAAGQLELMLLENLQRVDLTAIEEADGYQGLLDLGVTTQAIADRTGRSTTTVRSRLRLLVLPEAAREKLHAHQATLDDTLQLLEFIDHPEVLADLTGRLGDRDFVHYAQRAKDDLAAAAKRAVLLADLEAQGVTVVDRQAGSKTTQLDELTAKPPRPGVYAATAITVAEHATCPGHVAWVHYSWQGQGPYVVYGCADPKANGHHSRYGSASSGKADAGTPEARAARRELIDNNKAAASAETVRRAWIHDLLQRAKMPDDAALYAARIIRPGNSADYREKAVYTDLLYAKDVTDRDADADLTTAARGLRHLVALAAARVEASMPKDYWRLDHRDHATHLAQLAAWGYPLADVEQAYLAKHAPKGKAAS